MNWVVLSLPLPSRLSSRIFQLCPAPSSAALRKLWALSWWAAGWWTAKRTEVCCGVWLWKRRRIPRMSLPATAIGAAHRRMKPCSVSHGGFARSIAIKPRESIIVIGTQGCWSDWLRAAGATEARRNGSHQVNSNSHLPLTVGSIEFQRSGIKLRWDLGVPMASVMVTMESEVIGECIEWIWIDVGLKKAEALFAPPCIFVNGLGD